MNKETKNITNVVDKHKNGWGIFMICRHGSTDSNGEKSFRGWKEVKINQLSEKGKQDVIHLGNKIKEYLKGEDLKDYIIVSSDLNRAKETANKVADITGIPIVKGYKDLRSQDTGDFTGKKEDDVKGHIEKNIDETPNTPLPGASESYNQFIDRIKNVLKPGGKIEKDYPRKKIIVISHHQVQVLQYNDFNRATEPMFKKGIEPGEFILVGQKKNKNDGKGGPLNMVTGALSSMGNTIGNTFSNLQYALSPTTHYQAPPEDQTYNFRGIKINNNDLSDTANIIANEIKTIPKIKKYKHKMF